MPGSKVNPPNALQSVNILVLRKQSVKLSVHHQKWTLYLVYEPPKHLFLAFMLSSDPGSVLNANCNLIYFSKQLIESRLPTHEGCTDNIKGLALRTDFKACALGPLARPASDNSKMHDLAQVAFPLGFLESINRE